MFSKQLTTFSLFAAFFAGVNSSTAESVEVDVVVQTAHLNNAGTGNKIYFSLLYKKRGSGVGTATAELVPSKRTRFTTGNTSTFRIELDCPASKVQGCALSVGPNDNAWACAGFEFQIIDGGKRSQIYSMEIPKKHQWFSAAANDGGKKAPAKQYRWWAIQRPKFSVKQESLFD
ncbi:MAG: hypothetical protein KDB27_11180 [Planctomycetales bacterium]|nr:hypothetical protein [Planctomycetales bacterium]